MQRNRAEAGYSGAKEAFLATLNMVFTIAPAQKDDLQRAEELTVRTNQLNTSGITYSYDELEAFRLSDSHKLLMAGLEDKFGDYGKIGLALVECGEEYWTLKLLLISCRVISRGVGNILLQHIMGLAKEAKVRLRAEFLPNERNRMMFITFRFAGFKVIEQRGDCQILESDLSQLQPVPAYVKVVSES
jgi:FkbH-like protein